MTSWTEISLKFDYYHPHPTPPPHREVKNNAAKTEQVSVDCSQTEDLTRFTAEQAAEDATDDTENVSQSQCKDVAQSAKSTNFQLS